jgi:hypothetical protein
LVFNKPKEQDSITTAVLRCVVGDKDLRKLEAEVLDGGPRQELICSARKKRQFKLSLVCKFSSGVPYQQVA